MQAAMTAAEIVYLLGAIVIGFLAVGALLFIGPRRDMKPPQRGNGARHLNDVTAPISLSRPRHAERDIGVARVEPDVEVERAVHRWLTGR